MKERFYIVLETEEFTYGLYINGSEDSVWFRGKGDWYNLETGVPATNNQFNRFNNLIRRDKAEQVFRAQSAEILKTQEVAKGYDASDMATASASGFREGFHQGLKAVFKILIEENMEDVADYIAFSGNKVGAFKT